MRPFLIAAPLIFALAACEAKQESKITPPAAEVSTPAPPKTISKTKPSTREELIERARKRHGREPTLLDVFDEAMHEAKLATGSVKEPGQPRVVEKGAKPEVSITGERITYNQKELKFDQSLNDWERILGKPTRRDVAKAPKLLVWDELGFDVLADKKNRIKQITFYINKRPPDPYAGLVTHGADGKPVEPSIDYSPQKPFSGYLEIDGFGIDAKTEFWEIVKTANPKRNLHCPLRDCSHPSGSMGDNSGSIYFILNRGDERGNIYELSISSQ